MRRSEGYVSEFDDILSELESVKKESAQATDTDNTEKIIDETEALSEKYALEDTESETDFGQSGEDGEEK